MIYYHYPVQLNYVIVEFSNMFDNYDINMKNAFLLNSSTEKYESQMSWNWHDWNYIGENSKNKKQSMKKSIALHFSRSIYVNENLNTNLLSTSEKLKVNPLSKHDFDCMT